MIPTPVVTHCPACQKLHLDEGEWVTRAHRWHRCVDDSAGKGCGHEWKMLMFDGPTVGVATLPESDDHPKKKMNQLINATKSRPIFSKPGKT